MPPLGHFNVPLDAAQARHYLGFAAGSGITPLLSIVKTTLAAEPRSRFTLVYGNRASSTVMFREELAALKDLYLGRFNLVHVLSREAQDIELLHGRIDRAKADALLAHWVPLDDIDAAFVCGPEGMMEAVVAALKARGFPDAKIRIERFAASIPKHTHVALRGAGRRSRRVRSHGDASTAPCARSRVGEGQGEPARGGPAQRRRAAVLVQGRRVLDVPLPRWSRAKSTWTSTSRSRTTRSRAATSSRARATP